MIDTDDGDINANANIDRNIDIKKKDVNNSNAPTLESALVSATIDEIGNNIDMDGDSFYNTINTDLKILFVLNNLLIHYYLVVLLSLLALH